MMPGWTTATRFSRSISRIRSIAVKAIVRPPSMPAAPPDRPVPAPRGTIGTRSSAADPDELGDLGGRRREARRRRAGRPAGRASRRVGTTRGRSRRSAAAGRGGAARIGVEERVGGRGRRCRRPVVGTDRGRCRRDVTGRAVELTRPSALRSPRASWRSRSSPVGLPPPPAGAGRAPRGRRRAGVAGDHASPPDGDIVPGLVDRSSLDLDATYDASLRARLGDARDLASTRRRRSRTPRAAPIDRVELNTIAARLGGDPPATR